MIIPARYLAFTTQLVGGVSDPLDPHVQIPAFGACGFSRLLIRNVQQKRGLSVDHLRPYPSRPLLVSRVFLL